jgi:hypothetical protein
MGKYLNKVCFQDKILERLMNNVHFILTDIIFANTAIFKKYININKNRLEIFNFSLAIIARRNNSTVNLKHIIKIIYINI